MISLDPPPLVSVAEHMRDETWLDVKVVGEPVLERVRLVQIIVNRHEDYLVFTQERPGADENGKLETIEVEHKVDAEDVMYLKPTIFELADITPRERERVVTVGGRAFPLGDGFNADENHVLFAAISLIANDLRTPVPEILDRVDKDFFSFSTRIRYSLLWLVYEFTECSTLKVCHALGYSSITPYLSAKNTIQRNEPEFMKPLRKMILALDARLPSSITPALRHDAIQRV